MTAYNMEIHRYPFDEHDEDDEPIAGLVAGYTVFCTIRIGRYTIVRAVVENKTGQAARSNARAWYVEWKATFGTSTATQRMTGKMKRADALKEGERLAALVGDRVFASMAEAGNFYDQHPPTVSTYGD